MATYKYTDPADPSLIEFEAVLADEEPLTAPGYEEVKVSTLVLPARYLDPPHEVRSKSKYNTLRKRLQADGYKGRPIIGFADPMYYDRFSKSPQGLDDSWDNSIYCVTGSHRIAAAKSLGLSIPCLTIFLNSMQVFVYMQNRYVPDDYSVWHHFFDTVGLVEAAKLFRAELRHGGLPLKPRRPQP